MRISLRTGASEVCENESNSSPALFLYAMSKDLASLPAAVG